MGVVAKGILYKEVVDPEEKVGGIVFLYGQVECGKRIEKKGVSN